MVSQTIYLKPLSVNKSWQGRRFKTKDYKEYESEMMCKLPNINIPSGKLELHIEWRFSNASSDIDNPTKPFIDILQKKYLFNDKNIYKLVLKKTIVKKGMDCIIFEFFKHNSTN